MTEWIRHRIAPATNGVISWLQHGGWMFVIIPTTIMLVAITLRFEIIEFAILSVMSAILITVEMINYAMEKMCDFVEKQHNGDIKLIKDISAGAVAVSTFGLIFALGFMLIARYVKGVW